MVRRNLSSSLHLGFQAPSVRRNASLYNWSRPPQNGSITRRRVETWEPPRWIAVPCLALVGWLFMVVLLSF